MAWLSRIPITINIFSTWEVGAVRAGMGAVKPYPTSIFYHHKNTLNALKCPKNALK